jgi:hypothetical protein
MNLHVVLNDRILASSPRARVPIRSLAARRGDSLTIDVSFSMDGRIGPLPTGTIVRIAAYASPGSREPLVYATSPTIVGRGTATRYRFSNVSFTLSGLASQFAAQRVVQLAFEVRIQSTYSTITTAPVTLNVSQTAQLP